MPDRSTHFLGIDLGGTNVKAGVVSHTGTLCSHISVPTSTSTSTKPSPSDLSAPKVTKRIVEAALQAIDAANIHHSQVAAVGVVSPGQASLDKGIVHRASNLPLWKEVPLRANVSKALKLPAILENDANAAAYGEFWAGAGKDRHVPHLFMITLGTGVGGGYIHHGDLLHGANDFAAEIGHIIVEPDGLPCPCGQRGCLEMYASAHQTGKRAATELAASASLRASSSLGPILKDTGTVTAADVARHAAHGDTFAKHVWDDSCRYIAIGCINAARILDPELIVLAGGMSKAGDFLLDSVRRHVKKLWWKMTPLTMKLALAKLGSDAGVIGAAGCAKHAYDQKELNPIGK